MKKFIFILGGVRSGKSSYAVQSAKDLNKPTAFVATCLPSSDTEMKERIKAHKKSRPDSWGLVEECRNIGSALIKLNEQYDIILVDCLGLWISNLLADDLTDKQIERKIAKLIKSVSELSAVIIFVSNEVGAGVVPDNLLARRFRDLLGITNQIFAKTADEVIFMQSGIPVRIK